MVLYMLRFIRVSKLGEGEVRERGGSCSLVLSHCSSLSLLSPFFSTSLNAVGGEVRKQPLSSPSHLFFFSVSPLSVNVNVKMNLSH